MFREGLDTQGKASHHICHSTKQATSSSPPYLNPGTPSPAQYLFPLDLANMLLEYKGENLVPALLPSYASLPLALAKSRGKSSSGNLENPHPFH